MKFSLLQYDLILIKWRITNFKGVFSTGVLLSETLSETNNNEGVRLAGGRVKERLGRWFGRIIETEKNYITADFGEITLVVQFQGDNFWCHFSIHGSIRFVEKEQAPKPYDIYRRQWKISWETMSPCLKIPEFYPVFAYRRHHSI